MTQQIRKKCFSCQCKYGIKDAELNGQKHPEVSTGLNHFVCTFDTLTF